MPQFTARIVKVGINPCVPVPAKISRLYAKRGYVPVLVGLGGESFPATLVPAGGGRHRLYLHHLMRKAAGRGTGDILAVTMELDGASRVLPTPADLAEALRAAKQLKQFTAIAPSHRKELIRWVTQTKNPATRARRIARAVKHFTHPGSGAAYR